MYPTFFGLNEKPFAIPPTPRFLFLSERHTEALARLPDQRARRVRAAHRRVGTGKTTRLAVAARADSEEREFALILNPRMTRAGVPARPSARSSDRGTGLRAGSLKDLVDVLSPTCCGRTRGRRVVLIMDEAQNLSPEVLEQCAC